MKHGISRNVGRHRPGRVLCGIVCICVVMLSLAACRSHRQTVKETRQEETEVVRQLSGTDSTHTEESVGEIRNDTVAATADAYCNVVIDRDSAGRVVGIHSSRNTKVKANVSTRSERDRWFYGLEATRSSEVAETVGSVTEKKEETRPHNEIGIPVGLWVFGTICMLLIVSYLALSWKPKK